MAHEIKEEPEQSDDGKWSVNSGVSELTREREEKLVEQRQQDPEAYAAAYKQCPRCEKRFKKTWETKRHMG